MCRFLESCALETNHLNLLFYLIIQDVVTFFKKKLPNNLTVFLSCSTTLHVRSRKDVKRSHDWLQKTKTLAINYRGQATSLTIKVRLIRNKIIPVSICVFWLWTLHNISIHRNFFSFFKLMRTSSFSILHTNLKSHTTVKEVSLFSIIYRLLSFLCAMFWVYWVYWTKEPTESYK